VDAERDLAAFAVEVRRAAHASEDADRVVAAVEVRVDAEIAAPREADRRRVAHAVEHQEIVEACGDPDQPGEPETELGRRAHLELHLAERREDLERRGVGRRRRRGLVDLELADRADEEPVEDLHAEADRRVRAGAREPPDPADPSAPADRALEEESVRVEVAGDPDRLRRQALDVEPRGIGILGAHTGPARLGVRRGVLRVPQRGCEQAEKNDPRRERSHERGAYPRAARPVNRCEEEASPTTMLPAR
jgi:hypothetical protein